MRSSRSAIRCAGHYTAPLLCTYCMVSVLSFSGCSDEAQPAINDNNIYPASVPSSTNPSSPGGNCIDDDFC